MANLVMSTSLAIAADPDWWLRLILSVEDGVWDIPDEHVPMVLQHLEALRALFCGQWVRVSSEAN